MLDRALDGTEKFVGEVLDPEKEERLERIRNLCNLIAEGKRTASVPFQPFPNTSRNALVFLLLKDPFVLLDKRLIRVLATAVSLADMVSIVPCDHDGEGGVKIGFGVHDMWSEFHIEEK